MLKYTTVEAKRNSRGVAEFKHLFHEIGSITIVLKIFINNKSIKRIISYDFCN